MIHFKTIRLAYFNGTNYVIYYLYDEYNDRYYVSPLNYNEYDNHCQNMQMYHYNYDVKKWIYEITTINLSGFIKKISNIEQYKLPFNYTDIISSHNKAYKRYKK